MAIRLSPALSVLISISLILTSPVKCSPAKNVVSMKKDVGVVEFDWRDKGVISPVYNQGMLGDVMDYVITEGVESLHAIESQTSVTLLSVQETAACCNDASHQASFDCITRIGGLCTQQDYKTGHGCGNNTCTPVGKVGSTGHIPAGREDIMMEMILQTPLIVLVDASQRSFEIYSGGIYSDSHCSSTMLDFAMQLVGYGSDNGTDYWIVRNSWGVYWGEEGYMRIVRGKNMCGLATAAMYPIGYERYY